MKNKHLTILPNKFCKLKNIYDLTFGCGGFLTKIENFNFTLTIDMNISSIKISRTIYKKYFFIFNIKIKNLINLLYRFKMKKFNVLIYDQGFNTCQIKKEFYKLNKKKYIFKKKKFDNLNNIFYEIIKKSKKKFFFLILTFNMYEYYKLLFFIKKINKFKNKKILPNFFEKSLNYGTNKTILNFIYVKNKIKNKKNI